MMDNKLPQSSQSQQHDILQLPLENNDESGVEKSDIFKFPPDIKDLRQRFQRLLDYAEREEEFYKSIGIPINLIDCQQKHSATETLEEYSQDMDAVQKNSDLETSAALATYGTIRELTSLYTILDELSSLEDMLNKSRSVLKYAKLLRENGKGQISDNLQRLKVSNNVQDSGSPEPDAAGCAGDGVCQRKSDIKQQRERSKSADSAEISFYNREPNCRKEMQRLDAGIFSEGAKSKVSKWTKVKAAFKWERANVPALGDCTKSSSETVKNIGLTPVNNEVARYLRVPSIPYGGVSSTDSVLSSSSGNFLNEVCTPGTISSASSMDEMERRDSSKNYTEYSRARKSGEGTPFTNCCKFLSFDETEPAISLPARCACTTRNIALPSKSVNKSLRKSKPTSDFEALPEDSVANITKTTSRRTKAPPSPLNLDLQQKLNDLEDLYLLQQLKTPKDGIHHGSRQKKIGSPGNSSVPSSPSRLSDFFAEFESGELSSGDFSEPTSPNYLSPRAVYQYKQNEINRRYELLRKKLDIEFEEKRREWEKIRTNSNICRAPAYTLISSPKIEEKQPSQAKLLEENLTPEFKKKLQKWRVKKQSVPETEIQPTSTNKELNNDTKTKIDWNLWKAGQIKLEGQGLLSLPEHKNLPEEFQKKLEKWNKIKNNNNDAVKRQTTKSGDNVRKSIDEDRILEKEKRSLVHKNCEKDKFEKISKLKAIDHPVKEVQVKTSAGVMKFEGISRKFTRKLYEWEKARGIGPELSTFALLHPGYCPIDVGRITKEIQAESPPTLSRSLSLDSITPNTTQPNISQQASSLSLNDVNDLKERECSNDLCPETEYKKFEEPEAVMVEVEDHIVETASPLVTAHSLIEQQTPVYKYERVTCKDYCNTQNVSKAKEIQAESPPTLSRSLSLDSITPNTTQPNISQQASSLSLNDVNDLKERECSNDLCPETEYKKFEEPEAVMVEVEDHIVETASPLVTAHSLIEQQTPVYKYERVTCKDYCNTQNVQTYDSHPNLAPLHSVLERTDELQNKLKNVSLDLILNEELELGRNVVSIIRDIFPLYADNLMKPSILNAISDVQSELSRLSELLLNSPLDEACCQEILEERSRVYSEELKGLNDALELLRSKIQDIEMSCTPSINITSTILHSSSIHVVDDAIPTFPSKNSPENDITILKEEFPENSIAKYRNASNTSIATTTGSKKKSRLRRMGSRQNSKTESDSSDSETVNVQETPRRWKRKNYRIKQRSFDAEDFKKTDDTTRPTYNRFTDDMVYVLRVKPGHPIEQHEINRTTETFNGSRVLISPTESCVELMSISEQAKTEGTVTESIDNSVQSNIFVKAIRKIFRTVEEPNSSSGIVVVAQSLDEDNSDVRLSNETHGQSFKENISSAGTENTVPTENKQIIRDSAVTAAPKEKVSPMTEAFKLRKLCLSWNDLRDIQDLDSRKSRSTENLILESRKGFKVPLATDSFKVNKKHCCKSACFGNKPTCVAPKRKEHRFKKNTDKLCKLFSKSNGGNVKRCEDNAAMLDRNSLPEIKKSFHDNVSRSSELLERTPLTERAHRLQRAKLNFLEETLPRPKSLHKYKITKDHDNSQWDQNHLSDHNAYTDLDMEEGNLLKSLSAGTILQTEYKHPNESSYDTIPRSSSSRSARLSTRLGFASIASKFRRSKKDPTKQSSSNSSITTTEGSNALSTLCRKSLFADPIGLQQAIAAEGYPKKKSLTVKKSQSSQATVGHVNRESIGCYDFEKLNKSKSEQHVRNKKEYL